MKPNQPTSEKHFNQGPALGQPRRPLGGWGLTDLALALALSLWTTGCTNLYHRTRAQLPPDPAAEADLRIAETAQAEAAVQRAGAILLDNLQADKSAAAIQTDFDRLEAAAFDFERRALTAADAVKRSGDPGRFAGEMERLGGKARSWLEYVRLNRTIDRSQQRQNLRPLISNPGEDPIMTPPAS